VSGALPIVTGGFWGGIKATLDGVPILNTFAWKQTSAVPAGQAKASTIAHEMAATWPTTLKAVSNVNFQVQEAFCYSLENPTTPAAVEAMTGAGAIADDEASDQVAVLIKHQIAVRGKGRQGRTYLCVGGLHKLNNDGRTITPSYVSDVQTAWEAFVIGVQNGVFGLDGATIAFGVMSRKFATVTPRINSVVESVIATQRRRLHR
jgi:hypothetical protein